MKRVSSIYALLGSLLVAFSLSACSSVRAPGVAPGPDTLSTQSAAPEMRVRAVTLDAETEKWLAALKNSANYQGSGDWSLERRSGNGNVQDLSRTVNLQLTSVLAALRVTGDRDLLAKVYLTMQRARGALRDTDGDGYLNWRYLPAVQTDSFELRGTDHHVMEEVMAHSLVAQAAYAFRLNSDLDDRYDEAASFWTAYLTEHYEAKWRRRVRKPTGYPIIEKPLFHPYVNNTRYFHYMYKLTGDGAYRSERDRQVGVIKRHLLSDNGAFVWTHAVNEYLRDHRRTLRWNYQPVGYAGEALAPLADLGLEGVLDESTMRGLAKTVSTKLLDGKHPRQIMASDVGGARAKSYYVPYLNKRVTLRPLDYLRGTTGTYASRGYALLAPWDGTGEVGRVSASFARPGWPNTAAGVLLDRSLRP